MAGLVIWSQAESFPGYRESTMQVDFPEALSARWFEKSTDVCPIVRNGSKSPQWCGAQWRRQGTIREYFIDGTDIVTAATTPSCFIEITCNQVNVLRNHNGTKSLNDVLGNTFFLGINIADMQGYSKDLLTTSCSTTKSGT